MRLQGSGDGTAALQTLVGGLDEAASDQDQVLYLEALGNTGDARAFTAIEPYLSDARIDVRAAATHGLRFVAGELADAAIVTGS